jgi:two-component system, cell cycle sensor histidine kinase and response regulator CckA
MRAFPLRAYFGALVAVFVLGAAAAAVFVHVQADSDARSAARDDMDFAASSSAKELAQAVTLVRTTVAQLAASPGIAKAIEHPKDCSLSFGTGGSGHLDVIGPSGTVVCSSAATARGTAYGTPGWLQRARVKQVWLAPLVDPLTGHNVAVAAAPSAASGAVVVAFFDLDAVGQDLATRHGGGHPVEILVTTAGGRTIVVRSIHPKQWIGKPIEPTPFGASAGGTERADVDGTTRIYGNATVPGAGLTLYAGEEKSAVLAIRQRLERRELAIVAAGFLVALLAAFFVYRRLVQPIKRLSEAVRNATNLDGAVSLHETGPLEVVRLAEDVNVLMGSVARELGERRQAEDRLSRSEESYRLLFDRHPGPMWVYDDTTFRFLAVNDAAVSAYGYTHDEFLGMTIHDIRPPEDRAALREIIGDESRRGRGGDLVWRHLHKDGKLVDVKIRSADIEFGGKAARLVLTQDVTEQRHLEAQLLQSQKMEAVGSLAGGIAHDFNNLLTVVLTSASMLLRQTDDAKMRDDVERIAAAGARGADLTKQLLAFSRRQVLRPEVTDVNTIVQEALGLLHRLLGENIEISYELADDLSHVVIDRGQLSQAIVNLAVNARDAMPEGGRLTIATANVVLDEAYAADHVEVTPGPHVLLQVTDSGIGMSEELRERAFEPFFTTKPEGEGTGLGLATVYGVIKQSGGNIWLYSEPGFGTTFKLYFPRADAPVEAGAAKAADATGSLEGSETILLVEDDPAVRPLVALTLRSYGYAVTDAATPQEALELAARGEPFDLLVTDVVMPGMNGRELAERLTALQPGLKVLFTSGYPADAMVRAGIADASTAYIEKPYLPDELAQSVRTVLG